MEGPDPSTALTMGLRVLHVSGVFDGVWEGTVLH